MERVKRTLARFGIQADGEHVLARRHVPGRGKVEVVAHPGVVTRGQVLGFGRQSVAPAHGNTLRESQWYAKWSGARGTRPLSPELAQGRQAGI